MAEYPIRLLELRFVKGSELSPNKLNWRKHPKRQHDAMTDVLKKVGWVQCALYNRRTGWDTQGKLIDGHLRQKIAADDLIPVLDVDLSPEEEKLVLATLDPLAMMAETEREALEGLLRGLKDEDETLAGLLEQVAQDNQVQMGNGAGVPDVAPQVDKAGELRELWGTERGQVWVIGGVHRVMCGDSTSGDDVARLMDGKRADCVVTDPPYGMKLDTNYKRGNTGIYNGVSDANRNNYPSVIGDDSDFDPMPIMKLFDCTHQFWFGADYYAERIPNKNDGAWLVWDKKTGIENVEFSLSEFELIWSKKRVARQFIRVKWFGIQGMEKQDTKTRVHPTQKPLDVIKWIIEKYCDGVIVDPFLGSGTTLIACAQTGRVCYGMEISAEYVAVILQRAKDAGMSCELMRPTPSPSPLRGEGNKPVSDGEKIG